MRTSNLVSRCNYITTRFLVCSCYFCQMSLPVTKVLMRRLLSEHIAPEISFPFLKKGCINHAVSIFSPPLLLQLKGPLSTTIQKLDNLVDATKICNDLIANINVIFLPTSTFCCGKARTQDWHHRMMQNHVTVHCTTLVIVVTLIVTKRVTDKVESVRCLFYFSRIIPLIKQNKTETAFFVAKRPGNASYHNRVCK